MTYSAPELLLVGAAQNLVLFGSPDNTESGDCPAVETDDDLKIQYDLIGLW